MKLRIPFILGFLCSAVMLSAQKLTFHQYTVEDGLPSTYIYDILEDDRGYIWITTEAGLCTFDGTRFDNNPVPEYESEEIINITQDTRNRIWFSFLNGRVAYKEKGKITELGPFFNTREDGKKVKLQIDNIQEDSHGSIWLLSKYGGAIKVKDSENDSLFISDKYMLQTTGPVALLEQKDTVIILGSNGFHWYAGKNSGYEELDDEVLFEGARFVLKNESGSWFSSLSGVYEFNLAEKKVKPIFKEFENYYKTGVNSLFRDSRENVWIPTKTGLILLGRGKREPEVFLQDRFVGLIMEDTKGNYWITTQKDGLYFLPTLDVRTIGQEKGLTSNLLTSLVRDQKGRVVVGTDDNSFTVVSGLDEQKPIINFTGRLSVKKHEIYRVLLHSSGNVWFFSSSGLFILKKGSAIPEKQSYGASFKTGKEGPDGLIWVGASGTAGYIDKTGKHNIAIYERTYGVEPAGPGEAWIGCTDGMYHYKIGEGATKFDFGFLEPDVRDIELLDDGTLWLATKSNGLLLVRDGKLVENLTQSDGLPSNSCKQIYPDGKYVWVATNNGLARMDSKDYSIMVIGNKDGMPSREVNGVTKTGNTMVVSTNKGLAYFPDTYETFTTAPKILFRSLRINEEDTTVLENYNLDFSKNNIKVAFTAIASKPYDDLEVQYMLEGLDNTWLPNQTGLAEYPSLASGDYTLKVRAKSRNSDWSEESKINFTIGKPYWEEWWYFLLWGLLVGTVFFLVSLGIIRYSRKQDEIRESLKSSRLTALRSQMNPHFMFNSLNSIQEFILIQDKRSANKYLSKFSRLMRSILDMSDRNRIPLSQELEALELYLELEAMRFDGELEYEIKVGEGVNPEFKEIPSMLIQPYVENAIKHGLMHKPGDRTLTVSFRKQGTYLVCEVDDNGIGRERSMQIRKESPRRHTSKAMSVTKERLELLNSVSKDNLNVEIIDKKHKDGTAAGTKVIIHIEMNPSRQELE